MNYLKWQAILGYVGTGTVSIAVLLFFILNTVGVSYSDDGNKTCVDCFSEIKVKSTYWEIKVENAGDKPVVFKKRTRSRTLWVNLDKIDELVTTDPKVKVEILVPTISKYAIMKHPDYGYLRPLVSGNTLIKRNTKAIPSLSRIILHGQDIKGTVKWNFDLEHFLMEDINIDPIWFGVSITPLKDCWTEYFTVMQDVMGEVVETRSVFSHYETIYAEHTVCSDYPINLTCTQELSEHHQEAVMVYKDFTSEIKIGEISVLKPRKKCKKLGYNISGKILNCEKYGWVCYDIGDKILAKAPHQSAKKVPYCQSGERCELFDKKTMVREVRGYSNTDEIKRLEIE